MGQMIGRGAPRATESQEQAAFVAWIRLQFPGVLIHSVPNGAYLSGTPRQRAAQIARLKAEGFVPGIPDLHIPALGLWIEMKRQKGGRLSQEQAEQIAALESAGDTVIVSKGFDEAKAAVLAHMGGKR